LENLEMDREYKSPEVESSCEEQLRHVQLKEDLKKAEQYASNQIKSVVALQSMDGIVIALTMKNKSGEGIESKDENRKECRIYRLAKSGVLVTFCNHEVNENILSFISENYFELNNSSRLVPINRMFKDLKLPLSGKFSSPTDAQVILGSWSKRKGPQLLSINTLTNSGVCLACGIGESSIEIETLLGKIECKSSISRQLLPEAGKALMLVHEMEEKKAGRRLEALIKFALLGQATDGKFEKVKEKFFDEIYAEAIDKFFNYEELSEYDYNDNALKYI
jgi:20S proteasome alpha/beta subunit